MNPNTQSVCRTCLKVINEDELYTHAESQTKYGIVSDILESCVSELNLDLSDGVVICCSCITMLRISYEFKLKCLNTEDKVFCYLKQKNLPMYKKINLADVIVEFNPVDTSFVNEEHKRNENFATDRTEIPSSLTSNRYSLNTTNTNVFKEDSSCQENCDDIIDNGLNKNKTLINADFNDGILMFDDLANISDVNNTSENDYSITRVYEVGNYRNTTNDNETFSQDARNCMDWDMTFERCRLNTSMEDYCENLFEIPSCSITEDLTTDRFIFRPPSIPTPKRK